RRRSLRGGSLLGLLRACQRGERRYHGRSLLRYASHAKEFFLWPTWWRGFVHRRAVGCNSVPEFHGLRPANLPQCFYSAASWPDALLDQRSVDELAGG